MSKHISKNETWIEVSSTKISGMNGYVECNRRGLWDAIVVYQIRTPLQRKGEPKKQQNRTWHKTKQHLGEWKRPRDAMRAIESKVKEMKEENNPDRII